MVDREARRQAYGALWYFANGNTTNDEFEAEYPDATKTTDRAIKAVETMIWHFYADNKIHRLTDKHAPNLSERSMLERCLLFLKSDREYTWSINDFITCGQGRPSLISMVFGRGREQLTGRWRRLMERVSETGDMSAWPFETQSDLAAMQRTDLSRPT